MLTTLQIVILAAGKGTRMKSDLAKVLHPLLGKPMVYYVLQAALQLKPQRIVLVNGHQAEEVKQQVQKLFPQESKSGLIQFALQVEQNGTGHAVWCAKPQLKKELQTTLILNGDGPLITSATLQACLSPVQQKQAELVVMSFKPENPFGYGRMVKSPATSATPIPWIKKIVEERDTNADEKKIGECCGGIYAVGTENLLRYLEVVMRQRIHAEYYLTDIVPAAIEAGHRAVSVLAKDPTECMGINTPEQLHEAEKILTRRF
jgi:UDP-N-acetylglucosamine diphosphorylase/glucosamine-1-phosphate N-acetyltransferase